MVLERGPGLLAAITQPGKGDPLLVAKHDRLGSDPLVRAMIELAVKHKGGRVASAAGEGTDSDEPIAILRRRLVEAFRLPAPPGSARSPGPGEVRRPGRRDCRAQPGCQVWEVVGGKFRHTPKRHDSERLPPLRGIWPAPPAPRHLPCTITPRVVPRFHGWGNPGGTIKSSHIQSGSPSSVGSAKKTIYRARMAGSGAPSLD